MVGMKVRTVAMDQQMNPVVLLVDKSETLALPIWIGTAEAQSIALELQGVHMPRPMTHDLLRAILTQLTVTVNRIVVTDIQNGTYFAEIHLQNNGADVVIDSRPSDAIALALRTEAPIFVEEKVAATAIPLKKAFDEHEAQEFKKFLDKVKPQDFRQ
jgi:bifunctional DNase/RNase